MSATACGSSSHPREDAGARDAGTDAAVDAAADATADAEADAAEWDSGCSSTDDDQDGFDDAACGGDDCDDRDPAVHPGVPDLVEPSGWQIEVIEAVAGGRPGIALGPGGTPYLLYRVSDEELRVSSWSEAGVTIDTLSTSPAELGEGIASAPDGTVVVAYLSEGVALEKLRPDGGEWSVERMDVDCHHLLGLAVDAAGDAAVLCADSYNGPLTLFRRDGSTPIEIDSSSANLTNPSLAVDEAGAAHIAVGGSDLSYFREVGGEFEREIAYEQFGALFPSLVLRDGSPEIVYYGYTFGDFQHASRKRGWSTTVVEAHALFVGGTDAALGPDGTLHVIYNDGWHEARRWGFLRNGSWALDTVREDVWWDSIAVDAEGIVHAAGARLSALPDGKEGWETQIIYGRLAEVRRLDQDCDGTDGVDSDGDHYASVESGGTDCDDQNHEVHPGAREEPGGRDLDCDGEVD